MKLFRKLTQMLLLLAFCTGLLAFPAAAQDGVSDPQNLPAIVDPFREYTYEQMCADLEALRTRYPKLISVSSIGTSVEGREIPVFTLGTGKREVLICATMHAREFVCTNFVMYMAEQYCMSYEKDERFAGLSYRKLFDNTRLVIVPMLNPDGVNIAQKGLAGAKDPQKLQSMILENTMKSGFYAWKANANGVDLNRNWPYFWGEDRKIKAPASANYNGTGPCTEPEIIAMKNLIDSTPYYLFGSLHTSGEVIYWLDGRNPQEMEDAHYPVVKKIADWIGYTMLKSDLNPNFSSYMMDYSRGMYGKPSFTLELCPYYDTYPYSDYEAFGKTVGRVLPLGVLMAEAAMNAEQGETAIDVTVEDKLVVFTDMRPMVDTQQSRTLVPIRAVCEKMGLDVNWNSQTNEITVSNGETVVSLTVGSNIMKVNEEEVTLDAAPRAVNGRTMMPIRAVAEAFGYEVGWDAAKLTVTLNPAPIVEEPELPEAESEGEVEPEAGSENTDETLREENAETTQPEVEAEPSEESANETVEESVEPVSDESAEDLS